MAPEQARNAHAVDARADVFGLGATLFYALTGQAPFADAPVFAAAPPSARALRPDVPAGLDAILSRMMAHRPGTLRYPTAEAVMRALLPYLPAAAHALHRARGQHARSPSPPPAARRPWPPPTSLKSTADAAPSRVLIVDDQPDIRRLCRVSLVGGRAGLRRGRGRAGRHRAGREGALRPRAARRRPAGLQRRGGAAPPAAAAADAAPQGRHVLRRRQRRRAVAHPARRGRRLPHQAVQHGAAAGAGEGGAAA